MVLNPSIKVSFTLIVMRQLYLFYLVSPNIFFFFFVLWFHRIEALKLFAMAILIIIANQRSFVFLRSRKNEKKSLKAHLQKEFKFTINVMSIFFHKSFQIMLRIWHIGLITDIKLHLLLQPDTENYQFHPWRVYCPVSNLSFEDNKLSKVQIAWLT